MLRKDAEALESFRLRLNKLRLDDEDERRLRLEEEAAAMTMAEAISEPEPEEREEGELGAHKGDGKQDRQLEDGEVIDTEASRSMEDGKDEPTDSVCINTTVTSINSPTSDNRRPDPLDLTSATTSRNHAIRLVQEQEDGLTTAQKIAMISCFMDDVIAASTYILLTDPEVRQGWILMMLKRQT